jgi:photosystem II stability/assembly factor-like uncharacterized protein
MLYAAMRDSVFAVADSAVPKMNTLLTGPDVECLTGVDGRLLVGTLDDGLYRSTDAAGTALDSDGWERVGTEMSDRVTSLAASPHDPEVAFAGTEPTAVWRTDDGGGTWRELEGVTDLPSADRWSFPPRPHTHHARWLEPDPHDPARLYVGVEAGAFVYTEDGGETWRERPPGSRRDNHTLATHPDAEGRVYAAAGDGYAESTDGGKSWTEHHAGLDHRYVWSVAPDPGDPDTVVVSAARGAYSAHRTGSAETYLYRRRGRAPWERLDGIPTGDGVLRAVLEAGSASEELYALDNEGLYRTADAGDSWRRLAVDWPKGYRQEAPRALVHAADTTVLHDD